MRVRVLLFAGLRERAGAERIDLELRDDAVVDDALAQLHELTGDLPVVMAVNRQYAGGRARLHAGDELALIPPVSGGSVGTPHVRVTAQALAIDALLELVRDPRAGAIVTFVGVTRAVAELDYEAYAAMAERALAEIVAEAIERHGLCSAAAEHRVGIVALSEPSVAVAVSAPHRSEAFAGASEIIDRIKAQAPIWKKEEGEWAPGVTPCPELRSERTSAAEATALRSLPAVHELAARLDARLDAPHTRAVTAARRAIGERRAALLAGDAYDGPDLETRAMQLLADLERPSLRRVLNATGVIVHTNLGRAPLPAAALAAVARAAEGYSNLELDLASGERGSRHVHVESALRELTGAEAAFAVNNGAAAVLLAVAALAGPGRAIVVSRGQLVEIGGGFRIPEVIAQSGAQLIEVGTTNRTRLSDYERALAGAGGQGGVILRVHPSNFRTVGFVADVSIEELCRLGAPVIDDTGSGVLADTRGLPALAQEPVVGRSIAAGAALVCCSGDKLLGGPQAGLLVGRGAAVSAARRHPLARAMRIDKLSLAALEATLLLHRDPPRARQEIPVLAMLGASEETLVNRARRLCDALAPATLVRTVSRAGGGALPLLELEGPAVQLRTGDDPLLLARALREGDPPLLARINDGSVLLDPRTLGDAEIEQAVGAVRAASDELARR